LSKAIPIVGMGAICAAGTDIAAAKRSVYEGRDNLSPLSLFDSGLKVAPLSGQVASLPHFAIGPHRTAQLAFCAVSEALSGFSDRKGLSLGFVVATTVGGMTRSELFYKAYKADPSELHQAATECAAHEPSALSGFLCETFGGLGFHTLSTACSTGLHAVGLAKRLIQNNTFDLCCAVGSDGLSLLTIRGFSSLMLLDPTGCKPFDKNRKGTSLGEGAGAICLASDKACEILNVKPLAFVCGWGASADCHHMTAPHPQGLGAQKAVRAALHEAEIPASDIGMIATHGTATPDNDAAEIGAMKKIFDKVPPFCSMKRSLGHTLAASGIIESIFAICAMKDKCVPVTAGFSESDEAIGLVPQSRENIAISHVLKNSFGFGGNNAAAIFSLSNGITR